MTSSLTLPQGTDHYYCLVCLGALGILGSSSGLSLEQCQGRVLPQKDPLSPYSLVIGSGALWALRAYYKAVHGYTAYRAV